MTFPVNVAWICCIFVAAIYDWVQKGNVESWDLTAVTTQWHSSWTMCLSFDITLNYVAQHNSHDHETVRQNLSVFYWKNASSCGDKQSTGGPCLSSTFLEKDDFPFFSGALGLLHNSPRWRHVFMQCLDGTTLEPFMSYLLDVLPKNSVKVIARFTHKSVLFLLPKTWANTQPEGKKLHPQLPALGVTNFEKVFLWCWTWLLLWTHSPSSCCVCFS